MSRIVKATSTAIAQIVIKRRNLAHKLLLSSPSRKPIVPYRPPSDWAVLGQLPIFSAKKYFFLQMSNNYISLDSPFDADQNCLWNLGLKIYRFRVTGAVRGKWAAWAQGRAKNNFAPKVKHIYIVGTG